MEVKQMPHERPNGVVTSHVTHRHPAHTEEESLLFVWQEGALEFTDDADTLQPSALCDYRIRAWNPEGVVDSLWS